MGGALDDSQVRPDGVIFPNNLKQVQAYFLDISAVDASARSAFLAKTGATFVDPTAGVPEVDALYRTHLLRDDMDDVLQPNMQTVRRWNAALDSTALNLQGPAVIPRIYDFTFYERAL